MRPRTLAQRSALNTIYNYIRKEGKFKLMGRKARNKNIKIKEVFENKTVGVIITDIDKSVYEYFYFGYHMEFIKKEFIYDKKEKCFEPGVRVDINDYDFIPARLTKEEKRREAFHEEMYRLSRLPVKKKRTPKSKIEKHILTDEEEENKMQNSLNDVGDASWIDFTLSDVTYNKIPVEEFFEVD